MSKPIEWYRYPDRRLSVSCGAPHGWYHFPVAIPDHTVPQLGSAIADFELPDSGNKPRRLSELAARGAVVAVLYRGHW